MDLKHVRSFLAVAKALNFSRAAKTLHLSQPALSTQIKALETHLGADLLVRNRRTVSLTPIGHLFVTDGEALLQRVMEVELKVRRMSDGDIGHLRIGFVASATLSLIPTVMLAFKKECPLVTLELKNLPTAQQTEALRACSLDIGFVRMPLEESDLTITLVASEPFVIVLPKLHPLCRKTSLPIGDLMSEPFIAYAERWAPAYFQKWTGICRDAGFTPNVVQETAEMDTAIALVAAGLGVAILPEGLARRNRRVVAIRPLPREKRRSEIGVAFVTNRQTELLKRLVTVAQQVCHS